MYTEALYTVDKERLPKLRTEQDSKDYHATTMESALLDREKAISVIPVDVTQVINHLPWTFLSSAIRRCNFPRRAKINVPACSCPNDFSLVPWNTGITDMPLNTDWLPLQCDIGSLECITVVRTSLQLNAFLSTAERGM